jgi:1,2-phenylacetyl-CoA epoxidase catalytic subunit
MKGQNVAAELQLQDRIWLLNEYRVAEVHGAGAIMRMTRLADSASLSADLSRHLRDEAAHAWLWTRVIRNLGGELIEVDIPYQTRLGVHFGIPHTLTELLALTYASELRGVHEYTEHLDSGNTTAMIQRTLRGILRDEHWHVRYVNEELQRRARADRRVQDVIDRALAADALAIADLAAAEASQARV